MLQEVIPGVSLIPQNGGKGFGFSHFVERSGGNLVLDASRIGSLSDAFDDLAARGGVHAVVISDRHLGGVSTNQLHERFGAAIYCSDVEAEAMGHRTNAVHIDHILPLARHSIEPGFALIPTPGHTAGQFSTLVDLPGARVLFTADFVWRENGRWRPGASSRKKMLASFEGLRDLAFDVVVPWTAYSQTELFVPIRSVDQAVDEMIAACPKP